MELMEHQLKAVNDLANGKILWGTVGSGKSATALAYYMKNEQPKDIYVITTAKKRDSLDWLKEASLFGIGTDKEASVAGTITIDSWNNLGNYVDISDAFFVFDEQRLVGSGSWVKSFYKIAASNNWILLSGTPGDSWLDYAPVFIANGFYRNITEFKFKHVLYEPFVKYPKVRGYLNETKLELLRNDILVEMPFVKHTERVLNWMDVGHDLEMFKIVYEKRWNPYEQRPIKDVAELFRLMRRVVNTDPSRLDMVKQLLKTHPRLIVFYNFNYELDILRELKDVVPTFEYNGHKKDLLPEGENWVYLVQYVAGAEGWNCITTDAVVMYSMTYSYKNFEQAQGRIDRLNTLYSILYYYVFVSNSVIDRGIKRALDEKRSFNEKKFALEEKEIVNLDPLI